MEIGKSRIGIDSRITENKSEDALMKIGEHRIGVGPEPKKSEVLMTVGQTRIEDGSRIGSNIDTSLNKNEDRTEEMFFSKMMIEMAENGEDFSAILNRLDTPKKLVGVYREISKALDPSLDDKKWDAVDGLLKVIETKRLSQKNSESGEVIPQPTDSVEDSVQTGTEAQVDEMLDGDDTVNDSIEATVDDETLGESSSVAETGEVSAESTVDMFVEEGVENNEPSLDQKVAGMKEVLKQKGNVLRELKTALNGGEFTFNQGDPDWLQACSELLGESGLVSSEMARQILESAQEVKQINDKKLRGEERTDAIDRLQGRIGIVQKGLSGRKSESSQLDARVSQQVLFEQATFSDFEQLMSGKDLGSRFSGLEGYWKNMQKFLSADSRLSGAKAVVDEILSKKIFSAPANEKGMNALLSQKKRELEIAVRNIQISERAA